MVTQIFDLFVDVVADLFSTVLSGVIVMIDISGAVDPSSI